MVQTFGRLGIERVEGVDLRQQVGHIGERVAELKEEQWLLGHVQGVHRTLTVVRSHYRGIDYDTMSEGYAPVYTDAELAELEAEMKPFAVALADNLEVSDGDDTPEAPAE